MKRTTDPSSPGTATIESQGGDSPQTGDRRAPFQGLNLVPSRIFFTKGVGSHRDELRSFELALKDAGIEKLNLVHVSSIFPPNCKIIPRTRGSS